MKFVTRQEVIDYYLDKIINGAKLTQEQSEMITHFAKVETEESERRKKVANSQHT